MSGELELESTINVGTKATFTLPAKRCIIPRHKPSDAILSRLSPVESRSSSHNSLIRDGPQSRRTSVHSATLSDAEMSDVSQSNSRRLDRSKHHILVAEDKSVSLIAHVQLLR